MIERIVVNTSPLLAVAKMQAVDVIGKLPFEFVCPLEVEAEITAGANQGYAIEIPIWVNVLSLNSTLSPLAVAALDAGEAAVIGLALEQKYQPGLY
jgi:predicted nucleic acid-binding protein